MCYFSLTFGIPGLFLFLDSIVYWLVAKLFSLFEALAGASIIQNGFFEEILDKMYVIVGVFMLFVVAYSLLKSIVEPDNLSKNSGKIVINIIISLILLGVIPIIFDYSREFQNIVIQENVIGRMIFPDTSNSSVKSSSTALSFLTAFLNIPDSVVGESNVKLFWLLKLGEYKTLTPQGNSATWKEFKDATNSGADDNILQIGYWAESVYNGRGEDANGNIVDGIKYIPLVSTLCGIFLGYVILSFCLDLGIRVIKLAFYQIMSPIPILLRIVPSKKSVFDNWVKACVATYMEVFIRILIMHFVVWLTAAIFSGSVVELKNNVGIYGIIIVLLGLFAFAKQAPKLISEIIGIDSGNIKLGIGGKLAAGGTFGAAAVMSGIGHSSVQGLTKGVSNVMGAQGNWNKAKAIAGVLPGAFTAGIGGGIRSVKDGFNAKTFGEAMKVSDNATKKTMEARAKSETYRAGHGGISGSVYGHLVDSVKNVGAWAGIGNIVQQVEFEDKFISAYDDYKGVYESGEYKAITEQINQLKAAKAAGVSSDKFGIPTSVGYDKTIDNLQQTQKKLRMDALRKTDSQGNYVYKDMAAYMVYNLSNLIQTNPHYAQKLGLDKHMSQDMAKKINLQNNTIYNGEKEMTMSEIVNIIEKSGIDGKGLFSDLGIANSARKADMSTVAYKEYKKQQENIKK